MTSNSYETLLRLAQQKAIDGKGGLAASITKMCLNEGSDLSKEEMELTFDILRRLLNKVEEDVRHYVSHYLSARDDVPRDLLLLLAEDTVSVAYPLLLESALLNEEDLITIIDRKGLDHAKVIARRDGITERISEKLIGLGDRDIIVQLLRNITAVISHPSMSGLIEHSLDDVDLQELLINRSDLPVDLAKKMVTSVSSVLRTHMLRKFQRYGDLAAEALNQAQHNLQAEITEDLSNEPTILPDEPEADLPQILVDHLENSDIDGFRSKFASAFELPQNLVDAIFSKKASETMALACRAAGFDRDNFRGTLFRILGSSEFLNRERNGKIQDILNYFDQLDQKTAQKVMERWRQTEF